MAMYSNSKSGTAPAAPLASTSSSSAAADNTHKRTYSHKSTRSLTGSPTSPFAPRFGSFSHPQQHGHGHGQHGGADSVAMQAAGSAAQAMSFSANAEYEDVQNKVYCKWLNARLEPRGLRPLTHLGSDFRDGIRLVQLIQILADPENKTPELFRYNAPAPHRLQKMENVGRALDAIKRTGLKLTNIGAEDIVDGNTKLILGMIWSLIKRHTIADISEEGTHARDGLLLWCQRRTNGYAGVDVQNFHRSFVDGRALCALIHRHRPDLLEFDTQVCDPSTDVRGPRAAKVHNLELAFRVARDHLAIPALLDVDDLVFDDEVRRVPDERSVMTYVAEFFHAFSSRAREEKDARTITAFVEQMEDILLGIHEWQRRAQQFLIDQADAQEAIAALMPSGPSSADAAESYESNAQALDELERLYCSDDGRALSDDAPTVARQASFATRLELKRSLRTLQSKLALYGLQAFEPPEGLTLDDLDTAYRAREDELWKVRTALVDSLYDARLAAAKRQRRALDEVRASVEEAQREIFDIQGALEDQAAALEAVSTSELERRLAALDVAEQTCESKAVSPDVLARVGLRSADAALSRARAHELLASFQALRHSLANALVSSRASSVAPEKLEEIDGAFRAFDTDGSNTLSYDELTGALGSLGIESENFDEIWSRMADEQDVVTYERFLSNMVEMNEDRLSLRKLHDAFRRVSDGKQFVTELDLRRLHLPARTIDFLATHLPRDEAADEGAERNGDDAAAPRDYDAFLEGLFSS